MKPAKKQNNQDTQKKQLSENKTTKIEKYFKSAPKSFVVEVEETPNIRKTEAFYIDILTKKLQNIKQDHVVDGGGNTNEDKVSEQEGGAYAVDEESYNVNLKKSQINCYGNNSESYINWRLEAKEWERKYDELKKAFDSEIDINWRQQSKEWETKYKELKKVYLSATVRLSEVDLKYSNLLKVVKTPAEHSAEQHVVSADTVTSTDDVFTKNELKVLEGMSLAIKKDSTFVLQCVEYAYKTDLIGLASKTLKGKPEWVEIAKNGDKIHHAAKAPLTPKKVERIKNLFTDRITKCNLDSATFSERIKESNVNKFFATAIKNIAKRQK